MCELDVFAGNFTLIDWDIHKLWLDGCTPTETVAFLNLDLQKEFPNFSYEMLMSDVNDSYRLFSMLEIVILNGCPSSKDCFSQFQLVDHESTTRLVESYYSLDSELCREIVGKKLSSRLRKDLDEICERPTCKSIKLRSARRQYDNVKRVFKAIEEMAGNYVTNIIYQFGLSQELAEKYATLVFAASFKFEMSKKRLNYLTFESIMNICLTLIDDWVDYGGKNTDEDDLYEPTLDKDFLTSLRDLKTLQDRDKEHRNVVCTRLSAFQIALQLSSSTSDSPAITTTISQKSCSEFENGFKTLSRGIVSVAVGLSHNKEVKEFFIHLVEKIVEPFRSMQVSKEDINVFLREYTGSITEVIDSSTATMLVDNDVRFIFARFMKTLHPAILAAIPE